MPNDTESTPGTPVTSQPTPAAPTTATTEPAPATVYLRPDGLGRVDFGTAADEAAASLIALFGEPSTNEVRDLGDVCVDDIARHGSEAECVHGVHQAWILRWADLGLEARFTDVAWPPDPESPIAPMHFDSWRAVSGRSGRRLTTADRIGPESTVGHVRAANPATVFHLGESMFVDWFLIELPEGSIQGWLDWNGYDMSTYVSAIQGSLNEAGADLVVDGVPGPRTVGAWDELCAGFGHVSDDSDGSCVGAWIPPAPPSLSEEVIDALGFPPDDTCVAELEAFHVPTNPAAPDVTALALLRPGGLGPVDFGTPADEAIKAFTELFGPPDFDDSGELDCWAMVDEGRVLVFESLGLTVVFTDWNASTNDPMPLHFASWQVHDRASPGDESLATAEGIGIGSTAADVRVAYPDATPMLPNVSNWGFEVRNREGSISGSFVGPVRPAYYQLQPDFVMAVQRALNSHGASLAVDGELGPRTVAALEAFAIASGIDLDVRIDAETTRLQFDDPLLRALWRLGLPEPGDQLSMLWAGQPAVCG